MLTRWERTGRELGGDRIVLDAGRALSRRRRAEPNEALLRQWRAAGPMLDYLNRFPDEYTLLDPR